MWYFAGREGHTISMDSPEKFVTVTPGDDAVQAPSEMSTAL